MSENEWNNSLIEKINTLKKERNAIILAHNYQLGEVQDIADFVGDSLELSVKAKNTNADVIVFCGVHFMAETAAILSPNSTVLLPSLEAGCPMADMIDAETLKELKSKHPSAVVVCYVNTSAEVKAYSDISCTSANAHKVVEKIDKDKEIIFIPDQHLGDYVSKVTNREMILFPGFCPTHARILPQHITVKKQQFPNAKIVVHPESRADVVDMADEVLSTGGMLRFANQTDAKIIIMGTELGIIHRLQKENPEKVFIPATEQAVCPNMKMIRLDEVAWALEEMQYEIKIEAETRERAKAAVTRMTEILA